MSDVKPDAEPFWFLAKYVGPDSEGSYWFSTGKSDWSRVKHHAAMPLYAKPASTVNAEAAEQFEARDAARYRTWRDGMIEDNEGTYLIIANILPYDVGNTRLPTAPEWDEAIDAVAASKRGDACAAS